MSYKGIGGMSTKDDERRMAQEILRIDIQEAKELGIDFSIGRHKCDNFAKLTCYIYPSLYSPVGTLNSIPELFEATRYEDEDSCCPKLDEDIILTDYERKDGFHFYASKMEKQNKIEMEVYCNIKDFAIKLQLQNFLKFIKNHTVISRLFEGHIDLSIARVSDSMKQLQARVALEPYMIRRNLAKLAVECAKNVKEMEQEAYVYRNRRLLSDNYEDDSEDEQENEEENVNENEENEDNDENDEEIKEPPKKIQIVILTNDNVKRKTAVERLHEEIRKRKEINDDDDDDN